MPYNDEKLKNEISNDIFQNGFLSWIKYFSVHDPIESALNSVAPQSTLASFGSLF